MSIWSALISPVTELVGKWQDRKTMTEEQKLNIKAAEVDARIRLIEAEANASIVRMQRDADAQNDLDMLAVKSQENSWKDEFVMLVFLAPFVASFFPQTQDNVKAGFEFLKTGVPDWYTWIIIGIFVAVFGFRRMLTILMEKKNVFTGKSLNAREEGIRP